METSQTDIVIIPVQEGAWSHDAYILSKTCGIASFQALIYNFARTNSKTDQNSRVNALRVSSDPDNMASGEN